MFFKEKLIVPIYYTQVVLFIYYVVKNYPENQWLTILLQRPAIIIRLVIK